MIYISSKNIRAVLVIFQKIKHKHSTLHISFN
jgi:hypothetical protein